MVAAGSLPDFRLFPGSRSRREEFVTDVFCRLDVRLVSVGRVRAFVDLHYGDFLIKGFRVVEPEGGKPVWVGMPRTHTPSADGSGGTKWMNLVLIPDAGRRRAFETYVLRAYREELKKPRAVRPGEEVSG